MHRRQRKLLRPLKFLYIVAINRFLTKYNLVLNNIHVIGEITDFKKFKNMLCIPLSLSLIILLRKYLHSMSAYSKDTRPFESSHLPRRVFIDFRSLSYFYKKEQTEVSFKWRKGREQTIGTVTCIHSYGSETTLHHTLRQQAYILFYELNCES